MIESNPVNQRSRIPSTVFALVSTGATSLTGFAINSAVSRTRGADDFGRFSLVYLAVYLLVATLRAGLSEPLLLHTAVGQPAANPSSAAGAVVGVCSMVALAAFGIFLGVRAPTWMIIAALVTPIIAWQDNTRFQAFGCRRPAVAALSDLITLAPLPLLLVGTAPKTGIESWAFVLWAAGAVTAIVLATHLLDTGANLRQATTHLKTTRHVAAVGLSEFLATGLVSLVSVLLLPLVATLREAAAIRVLQMMYSPITIAHAAAFAIMMPRLTAQHALDSTVPRRPLLAYMIALGGTSVAAASILYAWSGLGRAVFPSSFNDARPDIWAYLAVQLVGVLVGAVTMGLRAAGQYDRIIRPRLIFAALTPPVAIAAAQARGVAGFCLAVSILQLPVAAIGFHHLSTISTNGRNRPHS